jgi:hypothetical protein
MTGLGFLATFCLLVMVATAVIYLLFRRLVPEGRRTTLAACAGLLIAVVLAIFGGAMLWSDGGDLEGPVHIWALGLIAGIVGLITTTTMVVLKV